MKAIWYFKEGKGKNIAEKDYLIIPGTYNDSEVLKPNYTLNMDNDTFYRVESVPKEWKYGNAKLVVTEIEFED